MGEYAITTSKPCEHNKVIKINKGDSLMAMPEPGGISFGGGISSKNKLIDAPMSSTTNNTSDIEEC